MPSARTVLRPIGAPPRKPGFVKRAHGFVKRAPGFPMLWIGGATAAGIMIVTGGFGTGAMAIPQRIGFWAVLMGWSSLKWQLWFLVTVRKHSDWIRAAAVGALLLSLPLPIEIELSALAVGIEEVNVDPFGTWSRALAMAGVVSAAIVTVLWATGKRPAFRSKTMAASVEGLLARARVTPEALAAIEAEDHYCRVRRKDGGDALIHYRFGDALAEVAELDGAKVHRGSWVAADAVTGAERDGRRWMLVLTDGTKVAVSSTHLPEARRRGWLTAPARV